MCLFFLKGFHPLDQFNDCQNFFDSVIKFSSTSHQQKHAISIWGILILLVYLLIVELYTKQFGQSLQGVQAAVEVFRHNLSPVLVLNLVRVLLTISFLDQLQEVLQLHVCVHLVTIDCSESCIVFENLFDRLTILSALLKRIIKI